MFDQILFAHNRYLISAFDQETGDRIGSVVKLRRIVNTSQRFQKIRKTFMNSLGTPIQWFVETFQRCDELNIVGGFIYRHCQIVVQPIPFLQFKVNNKT